MKKSIIILGFIIISSFKINAQAYNTLWIPDTLAGTTFNLTALDTFKQIINTGTQTITASFNKNIWGPTLIFNKWDVVHMNVTNKLADTLTVHWHGMHLPAIMDGGPHQTIPPNTTWNPTWQVMNNAATYWYHPHLDMMSQKQITEGLGGFIIVRDSIESALTLPRTYGVDDIPLAITDRDFNTSHQFVEVPYGDSIMVNGTLRAQFNIPAQVVRFRILDAAIETSYNLGFSDNRSFYVITTDGGLVNAPILISGTTPRFLISAGERVEILVNCTGQNGTSVFLKAYNASLPGNIPGGDVFGGGPFASYLGHTNYNILKLNIGTPTSGAITTIPSTLTTNTFPLAASASLTRALTISDSAGVSGILGPNAFIINHKLFDINHIEYTVPLDNTEIWQITSTSGFSHPFHIHDVEFYILSRNGATPPTYEQGWKDVVLVKAGETVKFIAKFSDYADALHPFMYHCHIALHEDEGMMGQFVVGNAVSGIMDIERNKNLMIFPNPTTGILNFKLTDNTPIIKAEVITTHGQSVMEEIISNGKTEINVSPLATGMYFLRLTDNKGQSYVKSYFKE